MKALVISKPVYDFILPLVEFPKDGDIFFVENVTNTLSSPASIVACTLGKYGIDTSFSGVVGEDKEAKDIKSLLESYKVDCKFLETNYEEHTCLSYKIYNTKSNKFTSINKFSLKHDLTKYKYDFIPDKIIMDDRDYAGNIAAINNYPDALTIFIADKFTNESSFYCNKCKYIICNLTFASQATGILNGLNKSKVLVNLYQKFIDLYSANLIIKLNNFDILYCINDEVRMIKNVNSNIQNKENIFNALLSYFLINDYNIENAIKLTNKALLSSANDLDMLKNIPEYDIIKKIKKEFESTEALNANSNAPSNNNVNNTVQNQVLAQNTDNLNQANVNQNIKPNNNIQSTTQGSVKPNNNVQPAAQVDVKPNNNVQPNNQANTNSNGNQTAPLNKNSVQSQNNSVNSQNVTNQTISTPSSAVSPKPNNNSNA